MVKIEDKYGDFIKIYLDFDKDVTIEFNDGSKSMEMYFDEKEELDKLILALQTIKEEM
jgi:hypothetical protein